MTPGQRQDWKRADDLAFLKARKRPQYEVGNDIVRLVDLFCGCGGLTLGFAEAARRFGCALKVALAVDTSADAVEVFRANFPQANVVKAPVESLFDGCLGGRLTQNEKQLRTLIGSVDILTGGPPCQGNSDLNNHTRRHDKRNTLYAKMARAAEVLQPTYVIIENIPTVLRDKGRVVQRTARTLQADGFEVDEKVLDLQPLGLPQNRKRHILVATRDSVTLYKVLESLEKYSRLIRSPRDLRWAIGDLQKKPSTHPFDRAASVSDKNARRIAWLYDHHAFDLPDRLRPRCHRNKPHTYKSVYGRLRWDEPAQTITSGFGSMGQGRYVHPSCRRTLTPHEAARIQFFPDFFQFGATDGRTAWAEMIGNAVPPKLGIALGLSVLRHILTPRT